MIGILTRVWQNHNVDLIYISLMAKAANPFFMFHDHSRFTFRELLVYFIG